MITHKTKDIQPRTAAEMIASVEAMHFSLICSASDELDRLVFCMDQYNAIASDSREAELLGIADVSQRIRPDDYAVLASHAKVLGRLRREIRRIKKRRKEQR